MNNNAQVTVAKVTQTANEAIGMKEKNLYYLVIETKKGKRLINVGEKTYKEVQELTDTVTKLQFEEPKVPQGIIDAAKEAAERGGKK